MPWQTGTATNRTDLVDKFVTFVTSGLGSQNWTLLETQNSPSDGLATRDIFLRAPGLTGTEQIYFAIRQWTAGVDIFNVGFHGLTGYLAGQPVANQPGYTSTTRSLLLWDSTMKYWFIANGRRAIIIAKVSTTYQSAYIGLLLPLGTPSEYSYPMFIGAMAADRNTIRWSATSTNDTTPFYDSSGNSALLRSPNGAWRSLASSITWGSSLHVHPYIGVTEASSPLNALAQAPGESPVLYACTVRGGPSHTDGANVYGELQGVFAISGYGQASENIVTVSGVDYLVVQGGHRTGRMNYAAYALE